MQTREDAQHFHWNNNMEILLQTDKASMLDEIIDYVKFLQLQVKVIQFFYT